MQGEPNLSIRAKSQILSNGQTRYAGEVFNLPEREGLGLVGTGNAEQVPGSGAIPPSTETGPQERGGSQGSPHAGIPGSANSGEAKPASTTIPTIESGVQGGFDTLRPAS